jgi:hypothetical protein
MTTNLPNPHCQWFRSRIGRKLQNTVASFLKIEKGGMSRRLTGEYKFKTDELVYLAGLFGEDLGEVTRRAALLRAAWKKRTL